jgi:tetratricopeptide (TPR) repeat protein
MKERRLQTFVFTLAMAVVAALTTAWQSAQAESARLGKLGTVNFPTSAQSEEVQAHFLRGVAALHSFWYPVALDEFRAATSIEPDFMMGYWGEAMAHNHPLWGDPQETEAARKVLEKITDTSRLMPIERAYLHAVKVLYGEGEKPARDRAYAAAMEQIHRDYPEDVEAALFYALALMATVHPEDPAGEPTRLRAGEIASAIYAKYPDHPGAAHYVIHAYDDPQNAPKALDAARRYADIAPAAPHALHMPSHIFLQLGMWQEAASSNEAAWAASEQWVEQKNLPISQRDYHDLHWLLYIYLQQGRYSQAEARLGLMRESLPTFPKDDPRNLAYGTFTLASMAASFLVETEQWDRAESLLPALPAGLGDAGQPTGSGSNPSQAYAVLAQIPAIFARGLAAAAHGSPEAHKSMAALHTIREKSASVSEPAIAHLVKLTEIQELEIAAMSQAAKSDFDGAMQTLRQATALEEAMPAPQGPPVLVKPSHELFGEILLQAGRPQEAAEQFATALRRHKNRARALLGAARAAARSGDTQGAAHTYAQFAQQWQQADTQLPELREARDYAQQARVR